MGTKIKTLYVIHHSHTDIGYTDLQERIIDGQVDYIRTVLNLLADTSENEAFRWNCETLYCVEQFLENASPEEKEAFFAFVRQGKIGISAAYLNFNDLLDCEIYSKRLACLIDLFKANHFTPKTAMIADINGISMGQRDAMLENGIEFLFTNIHTHHGMYPLYQNQTPFFWESANGKRLLVWNGEHYNLGNALGIQPNRTATYMERNYFHNTGDFSKPVERLHENLTDYISLCEENNYKYDFIISSVSGVFSDNAPPNTEILKTIQAYNALYGDTVRLQMVSLQELYALIGDKLADAPVYSGDMNDWWGNGVGSTPYAVKHYKEAKRMYHLAGRLDPMAYEKYDRLAKTAEDNLLLYAEHTWGHSATIIDPYDTMVLNLDMRKNSYASKAHEASAMMLNRIAREQGDIMRYYNTSGHIKVTNPGGCSGRLPVEYYIESCVMKNVCIRDSSGKEIPSQLSPHPRGVLISFTDRFNAHEAKEYTYQELPEESKPINSRKAYIGAERVQDIINDYEPETCMLPYEYQNEWFRLAYEPGIGITHFINKKTGENMLSDTGAAFFTPIYECTEIPLPAYGSTSSASGYISEQTRRSLGRNIRGKNAVSTKGVLKEIRCMESGNVFTLLELVYQLPGTLHCSVMVKFYKELPKIDFKLRLAKTLSQDIESVYLPLDLKLPNRQLYLKKGAEVFRPGIDQLPGSGMEYYCSDDGLVYLSDQGSMLVETADVPLLAMGPLKHHPIHLCSGNAADNQREVYSWVMNNTWETNFKLDLSGFCEFKYSLTMSDETDPEACFHTLEEQLYHPNVHIIS